jgi:hypothetical protein
MKHQRHFETTASREAAKTKALIADLDRIVQILDDAIAAEEENWREYPIVRKLDIRCMPGKWQPAETISRIPSPRLRSARRRGADAPHRAQARVAAFVIARNTTLIE